MEKQVAEKLVRANSPALDEILGVPFKVLDQGHVRAIDYMGDESTIVQAARVSYGKGTKKSSEDKNLIKYLLRHKHTTPFEMPTIMLHVRVPMDCWRQWIRHRTASVNEYSTRYSEAIDDKQETAPNEWRYQSDNNKQGSGSYLTESNGSLLSAQETMFHKAATDLYRGRLERGVAREQARKDLPLSTYTEAYWKMDLHNLLHFLMLRMDSHAQLEIRKYATVIGEEIVAQWVPTVWEAFEDFRGGMNLTNTEVIILQCIAEGGSIIWKSIGTEQGWLDENGEATKKNRFRSEMEVKFENIGIKAPWII